MTDVAKQIADGLQQGFVHPGDPEHDIPPTPIILPFKPSPSMPKEMGDLMNDTAKLLSECIVALIEKDFEIVPRSEAAVMRHAVGEMGDEPELVRVHCRCDTGRTNPLMILTVSEPGVAIINGTTIIRGLAQRSPSHPHPFDTPYSDSVELQQMLIGLMDGMNKRQLPASSRKAIDDAMHEFLNEGGEV